MPFVNFCSVIFAVSVIIKTTDDDDDDDDDDNEIMLYDGETTCQYIPFIVSLVITTLLGLPSWIVCYCKYKSTIKSGLSSCISKICRSKRFNIKHNGGDKKNKSS